MPSDTCPDSPQHVAPFPIPAEMLPYLGCAGLLPFWFPVLMLLLLFSSSKIQNNELSSLSAKPSPHHTQLIHQLNSTTSGDPESSVLLGGFRVFLNMRKNNGTVTNWKGNLDVCLGIDRVMIMMSNQTYFISASDIQK